MCRVLGSVIVRARLKWDRIFVRRVQADSRRLDEKARFLWNSSLVECRMQMALTQALILEIRDAGSESQFQSRPSVRGLGSLRYGNSSNYENVFVAECL